MMQGVNIPLLPTLKKIWICGHRQSNSSQDTTQVSVRFLIKMVFCLSLQSFTHLQNIHDAHPRHIILPKNYSLPLPLFSIKSLLPNLSPPPRSVSLFLFFQSGRRSSGFKDGFIASLEEKPPEGTVTIVFTGVQGISDLWNRVDGDAMGDAIERHDAVLRHLLRKFRGYEVKTEGTTFMVAFWTAWEALAWCLAVQKELVVGEWPDELLKDEAASMQTGKSNEVIFNGMRVYMGMQVGQPSPKRQPTTGRMDYYGPCVNKSARVAHAGSGGQVLITDDVLKEIEREVAEAKEKVKRE